MLKIMIYLHKLTLQHFNVKQVKIINTKMEYMYVAHVNMELLK